MLCSTHGVRMDAERRRSKASEASRAHLRHGGELSPCGVKTRSRVPLRCVCEKGWGGEALAGGQLPRRGERGRQAFTPRDRQCHACGVPMHDAEGATVPTPETMPEGGARA